MTTVNGPPLPPGVSDILQSRVLSVSAPCPALLATYVLRHWNQLLGVVARAIVTGHNTTTRSLCRTHAADCHVHTQRADATGAAGVSGACATYNTLGAIGDANTGPWINASVDATGRPVVWRLDVGASRAWQAGCRTKKNISGTRLPGVDGHGRMACTAAGPAHPHGDRRDRHAHDPPTVPQRPRLRGGGNNVATAAPRVRSVSFFCFFCVFHRPPEARDVATGMGGARLRARTSLPFGRAWHIRFRGLCRQPLHDGQEVVVLALQALEGLDEVRPQLAVLDSAEIGLEVLCHA